MEFAQAGGFAEEPFDDGAKVVGEEPPHDVHFVGARTGSAKLENVNRLCLHVCGHDNRVTGVTGVTSDV